MNKKLYEIFENRFKAKIQPYMEKLLPRDWLSEPFYYYLDNVEIRKFRSGLPTLVLEYEGLDAKYGVSIGAAAELIFCSALLMDDIIDEDIMRSNLPAAHIKYGNPRVVATSALVLAITDSMLCDLSDLGLNNSIVSQIRRLFATANIRLMKSFLIERQLRGQYDIKTNDLLQIFQDKTITGTTALAAVGCIMIKSSGTDFVEKLQDYGQFLGIAGQIKNDVFDFTLIASTRNGSSDIRNQYITYPVKKLLEMCGDNESRILSMLFSGDESGISTELKQLNIFEKCEEEINKYVDKAHELVQGMPLSESSRKLLTEWADCNRLPSEYNF